MSLTADDLKIAVLRGARPGDVVFFNVAAEASWAMQAEAQDLVIAAAKYLRAQGLVPVMLPSSITPVVAQPVPDRPPGIDLAEQLAPLERSALIDWHEKTRGVALQADDLARADWHARRIRSLRQSSWDSANRGIENPTGETASQTGDTQDRAAPQSTDARDTGPSQS